MEAFRAMVSSQIQMKEYYGMASCMSTPSQADSRWKGSEEGVKCL